MAPSYGDYAPSQALRGHQPSLAAHDPSVADKALSHKVRKCPRDTSPADWGGESFMKQTLLGSLGIGLFLALWEVIGRTGILGISWPPLSDVLEMLGDPSRRPLFLRALGATVDSTAMGYLWGTGAGLLLATVAHLLPALRRGSDRLAAVLNSVPSIALGPIFLVLLKRASTPAAVSSIHVFFIVFVSVSSGLQRATPAHLDLFSVLGADRLRRFGRLELPAALPSLVSGLSLAWPAALIGAIIGEWVG